VLDGAGGRTSILIHLVAVVALLALLDNAVAAELL